MRTAVTIAVKVLHTMVAGPALFQFQATNRELILEGRRPPMGCHPRFTPRDGLRRVLTRASQARTGDGGAIAAIGFYETARPEPVNPERSTISTYQRSPSWSSSDMQDRLFRVLIRS